MNVAPIITFLVVLAFAIALVGGSYGGTVKTYNLAGPSAEITPSPTATPAATPSAAPTPTKGKHHHKKHHAHVNTEGY